MNVEEPITGEGTVAVTCGNCKHKSKYKTSELLYSEK
jgi:hypothetical protein